MEEIKVIDNGGESCFGIYFYNKQGNRNEVHVYANNIEEALGVLFMKNTNVTYDEILDHIEI